MAEWIHKGFYLESRWDDLSLWMSGVDDNFKSEFLDNIPTLCKTSSGTAVTERSVYFALLRQCLEECDKSHPCKPKLQQLWPTRVIFVGDSDSTELELWETESKKAQLSDIDGYVALSHRWGSPTKLEKEEFCTTRGNHHRRLKGFSMNELPKTFKDAVQVTRALGKQYLWIDALCIIQGTEGADKSDWETEASRMEQVFGLAYCTIAASSAEDWTKGFLELKSTPRFVQDTLGRWTYVCENTADYTKDVDAAGLNQRAWVLQERVLSRRTIHFTASYTYWECGNGVRCENFTKLESPPGREHFLLDPKFPSRLRESGYTRTIDFIQFLFEKYAQSALTNESDRVVAISGLVERMEGVFSTKYRYGVFGAFLPRLLLWKRRDEIDRNEIHDKDQQLPSWSWMTYSRIHFLSIKHRLKVPSQDDLRFDQDDLRFDTGREIDTGREKVLLVQVRVFQNCTTVQKESGYTILDEVSKDVGVLSFDMPTCVHFQHCVVIGIETGDLEDAERVCHVLLVRKVGMENQFERVGLGEIRASCVSEKYCEGELS